MGTRLGLDIGTNSIGWWLYGTHGDRITRVIDGGVRIFSSGRNPKTGSSLAVDRRAARSMRRRRDRYLRRRAALMKKLAEAGLMPENPAEAKVLENLDPYELRARGLDEPLPLNHLGRALFHLNQRRGFKSNRKTDRKDNESGKIKDATARLDQEMESTGARTYGEFLHMRRSRTDDPRRTPPVRTRLTVASRNDTGKVETGYDFYPDRRHLTEEFNQLWIVQAAYHPEFLTDTLREDLYETIFFQRPLQEPKIGLCLFTGEQRLPKAHPLTQRRVLYETVNQLRITMDGAESRPLTMEERDTVIFLLDNKSPTKSPGGMQMKLASLAKKLKLTPGSRFTLETINRDSIACDPIRSILKHPDRFGSGWSTLDDATQWEIVRRIRDVQSDTDYEETVAWLMNTHDLDQKNAKAIANAPLPEGYSRLGETATHRILEALKGGVLTYSQAVEASGWNHSDFRGDDALDRLPYYGEILDRHVIPGTNDPKDDDITRFGRLSNPTVHIGLNQLRRLINKIIEVYGKPDQIVVELARDLKQSQAQRKKYEAHLQEATQSAIKRGEKLEELDIANTGANRMLLRLWEELGSDVMKRNCPYTGRRISPGMIFDGSCDVDHILPYSRTLDDSFSNRTLCLREANREKRNRTPWETWGGTDRWNMIEANLCNLDEKTKRWRFGPDAMTRFEGERNFLDRALVDTQYLSRIARSYLDALYDGSDGKNHVWVVPGKLTEMLRRHWGLNSLLADRNAGPSKEKNRTDHRHHAVDAAVIAAIDRGLVKRISDAADANEAAGQSGEKVARSTPEPWDGFSRDIGSQLKQIVVSHKADRGNFDSGSRRIGRDSTTGQLHNDTAYGLTGMEKNGVPLVVTRKPLDDITPKLLDKIRDPDLKLQLMNATRSKEKKVFTDALKNFSEKPGPYQGIRRVRLIEPIEVIEITDKNGKPYKGHKPDSNHCYEIWRLPDGKWQHQVISTYQAHQAKAIRPHPAAKRLFRLYKNDTVILNGSNSTTTIATVEKFDSNGGIELAPHTEANPSERYRKNKENVYIRRRSSSLKSAQARPIVVDEIGRIYDPGPPD